MAQTDLNQTTTLKRPSTRQAQSPDNRPSLWKLPIEVRQVIWRLLACQTRDIYLKLAVDLGPVHKPARVHLELDLPKLDECVIYPEVLHICSESRLTAQMEYLWFHHKSLEEGMLLETSTCYPGAFLNAKHDRFIICPDFIKRPGKALYFDFKELAALPNVEIWYDRLIDQFDPRMVTDLLAWAPNQLVVKEVVNPDADHSPDCICADCDDLDDDLKDSEDDRALEYQEEVEICRTNLKRYIQDFKNCPGEESCKRLVFKRGIEEDIDWAGRAHTGYGGRGMI